MTTEEIDLGCDALARVRRTAGFGADRTARTPA